jgi:hypothetical protein|tara:strand:- start:2591 stop:3196 length:606 start_codon:yes stop_codon:yes gene_type:complete
MQTKKENKHIMIEHRKRYGVIFLILGVFLLSSPLMSSTYAQSPDDEPSCLVYAYTTSYQHSFLLDDGKKAFGNNITIVHNCPYIEVLIDGNFTVYTENSNFKIPIQMGEYDFTFRSENYTKEINNVSFLPDRLTWEFDFYEWQNSDRLNSIEEYISLSAATAKANWASFLTLAVVFVLVIYVYWSLINAYIDRNFCEEVVQ